MKFFWRVQLQVVVLIIGKEIWDLMEEIVDVYGMEYSLVEPKKYVAFDDF